MKPTVLRLVVAFVLIVQFYSCDRRECSTDNPIFLENEVTSAAYQNEVASQIETIGTENLRFWLADYFVQDDQSYFMLYVQNDELCAQAMVTVNTDNPKLKKLLDIEGRGRFNAEFTEVNLEIKNHPKGHKTLEWRSYATIID